MRFTTLSNYHLIDDEVFFVCLRDDLILAFFCYSNLRRETGGFELASTITLVLPVNRLTKCASQINNMQLAGLTNTNGVLKITQNTQ